MMLKGLTQYVQDSMLPLVALAVNQSGSNAKAGDEAESQWGVLPLQNMPFDKCVKKFNLTPVISDMPRD